MVRSCHLTMSLPSSAWRMSSTWRNLETIVKAALQEHPENPNGCYVTLAELNGSHTSVQPLTYIPGFPGAQKSGLLLKIVGRGEEIHAT